MLQSYYKFLNAKDQTDQHPEDSETMVTEARAQAKLDDEKIKMSGTGVVVAKKEGENEAEQDNEEKIITCTPKPYVICRAGT